MFGYIESNTKVNVNEAADKLGLKAWTRPGKPDDVRFYLNRPDLQKVCLNQSYYKSGNVSGCEYIDFDGEPCPVAHSRAYAYGNKTYIDKDGHIWTNWRPYGYDYENFAEAVAVNLNRKLEDQTL